MPPPTHPKIYHIVHVDNLASILNDDALLSDRRIIERGGPPTTIGMSQIKLRRLGLRVSCHLDGATVGDYVPFYFCPRSVMLYVIHAANHENLTYRGGQKPIIHLQADMAAVVIWANNNGRRWAFSLSNAGSPMAEFRAAWNDLDQVNWAAVAATDFRKSEIKEGKQAEFLVRDSFPWSLVEEIGVESIGVGERVRALLADRQHQPSVFVRRAWYY